MGQVIDIATRQVIARARQPEPSFVRQTGLQYECGRCGAEGFRLYADGVVSCGDCGAAASNIETTFKGDKHGPRTAA